MPPAANGPLVLGGAVGSRTIRETPPTCRKPLQVITRGRCLLSFHCAAAA